MCTWYKCDATFIWRGCDNTSTFIFLFFVFVDVLLYLMISLHIFFYFLCSTLNSPLFLFVHRVCYISIQLRTNNLFILFFFSCLHLLVTIDRTEIRFNVCLSKVGVCLCVCRCWRYCSAFKNVQRQSFSQWRCVCACTRRKCTQLLCKH